MARAQRLGRAAGRGAALLLPPPDGGRREGGGRSSRLPSAWGAPWLSRCGDAGGGRPGAEGGQGSGQGKARALLPRLPEAGEGRMRLPLLGLLCGALLAAGGARAALLRLQLRGPPARELSPAFLSLTLDANLATDPRFVAFLG